MQEERTNVPKIRFKGFTKDWEQRKLINYTKLITKGTTPKDKTGSGKVNFVKVENLSDGKILPIQKITEEEHEGYLKRSRLEEGDILFSIAGTLGRTAIVNKSILPANTNQALAIIRSYDFDKYFLVTTLTGHVVAEYIRKNPTVGAQPNLSLEQVGQLIINTPIKGEQKKIGNFFKQLDDTITLHQRGLDLLKQTKKSYLQKMFPKKGEDKPEIRFAGFTDAWEQRKLGEMVKQFSIKSKKEDEYTVLSSTNSGMEIRDGRVSGTSNLGYKIVEDGDLVLSPQNLWLGNININDIGKGLVSPSYKTFKFTNINSAFLKPQLHTSKMLEEYKNSSTQGASIVRRNLELDSFYQIPMLVPTTEEQSKLGVFFESMDNTITLHQRELDSLKEMKKSLLQQMFV
ncbi:restriction endonuclease subunit S [Enterococcus faecium]|uniref:restriction endonuclease subunit S n=2 Tax=Enterococcus faecium TaxID=1352 RepID=UPI00298F17D5|nr:restriction endonuclease subunit S [Enterococcus faecium]MDW7957364.1 restriction endonuclease subunit S [Enterococcus faecium]